MVSQAYYSEYSDWVSRQFDSYVQDQTEQLHDAIRERRLDQLANRLEAFAQAFHMRGAVRIVDGESEGWHDVQVGYLANSYVFNMAHTLQTGWLPRLKDGPDFTIEMIAQLGLARLLLQDHDIQQLGGWLEGRTDRSPLLGKSHAGETILVSLLSGQAADSVVELQTDRKRCCQRRSAFPKRLTECPPYGLLDLESALFFPENADYPYPTIAYRPTEDPSVLLAIETYYQWLA